jgi:DNA polymerase III alpha subunit
LTGGDDGPLALTGGRDCDEIQMGAEWLLQIFGKGNVYAELQRHFNRQEETRNQIVVEIARRLDLPLLATNGVSQATIAQREVADVFTCLRNHVRLKTAGQLLTINSERYLKPAKVMAQIFSDLPEAIRTHSNFRPGSSSHWKIWAMSFHGIRLQWVKRWLPFFGNARSKVRVNDIRDKAADLLISMPGNRLNANWL